MPLHTLVRPYSMRRAGIRLLLLAVAPVLVSACAADKNPTAMPTGFKVQPQQYIVPSAGPVVHKDYPGHAGATSSMKPSAGEMASPMAAPTGTALTPVTTSSVTTTSTTAAPMRPFVQSPPDSSTVSSTTVVAPAPTPPAPQPMVMAAPPGVNPQWQIAADDLLSRAEKDFGHLRDPIYVREPDSGKPGETAFRNALAETMQNHSLKPAAAKAGSLYSLDYTVGLPGPSGKAPLSLTLSADGKQVAREKGDYSIMPPTGADVVTDTTTRTTTTSVTAPAPGGMQPTPSTMMPPAMTPPAMTPPAMAPSAMMPSPPMESQSSMTATTTRTARSQAPSMAPIEPSPTGEAPPPSFGSGSPSTAAGTQDDGPTYVYDSRSMRPSGKTAYEQLQGAGNEVAMPQDTPSDGR